MDTEEVFEFYRTEFVPAQSDLVGYISDKPRQMVIELENTFENCEKVLSEVKKLEFPGPGTAMAFAAAVAAGAAGYSRDSDLCYILALLSIVLASYTVAIELISASSYKEKSKTARDELKLIDESRKMSGGKDTAINSEEYEEIKQASLSRIKYNAMPAFIILFAITTFVIFLFLVVFGTKYLAQIPDFIIISVFIILIVLIVLVLKLIKR